MEEARRETPRVRVYGGVAGLAHAVIAVACIGRRPFTLREAGVADVAVVGLDRPLERVLADGRLALEARLELVEIICSQRRWGAELSRLL